MKIPFLHSRWLLTHRWMPDAIGAKLLRAAGAMDPISTASAWVASVGTQSAGRRVLRLADMDPDAQATCILLACSSILHQQLPKEDRLLGELSPIRAISLSFSRRGWTFVLAAKMLIAGATLAEASNGACSERPPSRKFSDKKLYLAYPREVDESLLLAGLLEQASEAFGAQSAATVALFAMGGLPSLHGKAIATATQAFGAPAVEEALSRHKDELSMLAESLWNAKAKDIGLRMSQGYFDERQNYQQRHALGMAPGSLVDNASEDNGSVSLKWLSTHPIFLGELAKKAFFGDPVAWRMATENKALGIINIASWGLDLNLAGPDGKRPIEVALDKGRALVFRALLDGGADASTKGAKARKSPISRSARMLRSGTGPKLLAAAERAEVESAAPMPTPEAAKPKPRRL